MLFNKYIRVLIVFFLITAMIFCHAQQMVQTPKDIFNLCQKDKEFIGKPLRVLLKEIKPPIKMVFAEGGWAEQAPKFFFFFMSKQDYDSCGRQGNLPLRLVVYVSEFFQWSYVSRGKEKSLVWTNEDEEKYGNLLITAIRVSGDCNPCETEPHINSK